MDEIDDAIIAKRKVCEKILCPLNIGGGDLGMRH